jgi:hypothetical protein
MNFGQLVSLGQKTVKQKGRISGLELFDLVTSRYSKTKVSLDQLATVLEYVEESPAIHAIEYVIGGHIERLYYYNPNKIKDIK